MNEKHDPMFFKKYMCIKENNVQNSVYLFFISSSSCLFSIQKSNYFCFWSAVCFSTCDFSRIAFTVSNLFAYAASVGRFLIKFLKWTFFWSRAEISSILDFQQSSFCFLNFSLGFLARSRVYCWCDPLTLLIRLKLLSIGMVWNYGWLTCTWFTTIC